MASLDGKLRLFFLPPYSPELNPDDQVWNHVKHHGIAKTALRGGKGELRRLVLARLRSLQRLPWTIRMFPGRAARERGSFPCSVITNQIREKENLRCLT